MSGGTFTIRRDITDILPVSRKKQAMTVFFADAHAGPNLLLAAVDNVYLLTYFVKRLGHFVLRSGLLRRCSNYTEVDKVVYYYLVYF